MNLPLNILSALIRILERHEEFEGSVRKFELAADVIALTLWLKGV